MRADRANIEAVLPEARDSFVHRRWVFRKDDDLASRVVCGVRGIERLDVSSRFDLQGRMKRGEAAVDPALVPPMRACDVVVNRSEALIHVEPEPNVGRAVNPAGEAGAVVNGAKD